MSTKAMTKGRNPTKHVLGWEWHIETGQVVKNAEELSLFGENKIMIDKYIVDVGIQIYIYVYIIILYCIFIS